MKLWKTQFGGLLMTTTGVSSNDAPQAATGSVHDYSATGSRKMKLLRQSLKRGLADFEGGKIQDGDSVFNSMIDAEDK